MGNWGSGRLKNANTEKYRSVPESKTGLKRLPSKLRFSPSTAFFPNPSFESGENFRRPEANFFSTDFFFVSLQNFFLIHPKTFFELFHKIENEQLCVSFFSLSEPRKCPF